MGTSLGPSALKSLYLFVLHRFILSKWIFDTCIIYWPYKLLGRLAVLKAFEEWFITSVSYSSEYILDSQVLITHLIFQGSWSLSFSSFGYYFSLLKNYFKHEISFVSLFYKTWLPLAPTSFLTSGNLTSVHSVWVCSILPSCRLGK